MPEEHTYTSYDLAGARSFMQAADTLNMCYTVVKEWVPGETFSEDWRWQWMVTVHVVATDDVPQPQPAPEGASDAAA